MDTILDIDLLRTFHTVHRLKRFKAAAEFLHKSPAAISMHIQRLESIVGGRLLERDNQAVLLTGLGKRVMSTTLELLDLHDRAVRDLYGNEASGRVILGVPDEYIVHVIQDILPIFGSMWPNVVLEIKTAPSLLLREQVARGHLDVAIIAQPPGGTRSQGIVLQYTAPVWAAATHFVLNEDGILPLALYASPCPYREAMTAALDKAGIKWRAVLDTESGVAVRACVEAGLGVSVIDRSKITPSMQILNDLPAIPDHEITILQAPVSRDQSIEAVTLLLDTIQQRFCY